MLPIWLQKMHGAIMHVALQYSICELYLVERTVNLRIDLPFNLPIKHWLTNVEVYDSVHSFINC